jgi:hypothetical protein
MGAQAAAAFISALASAFATSSAFFSAFAAATNFFSALALAFAAACLDAASLSCAVRFS